MSIEALLKRLLTHSLPAPSTLPRKAFIATRNLAHGHVQVIPANFSTYAVSDTTWPGRILCRFEGTLSESCNNVRALGDYLRHQQSSGYQPFFTVNTDRQKVRVYGNDNNSSNAKQIPITESMIEGMINRADFHFEDLIDIHVPSQLSSITINLRMVSLPCVKMSLLHLVSVLKSQHRKLGVKLGYYSFPPDQKLPIINANGREINKRGIHSEQTNYYPISGFPRCLIAEDTINGKIPDTILDPFANRTIRGTPRQAVRPHQTASIWRSRCGQRSPTCIPRLWRRPSSRSPATERRRRQRQTTATGQERRQWHHRHIYYYRVNHFRRWTQSS